MEEIGKTIRKIRLSKGYTQKEVYSGIVSKSYAIEFEKGKHDMTVGNFQKVLAYLNVDFDEFLLIHDDYQKAALSNHYQVFMDATNASNVTRLNKLLTEVDESTNEKDKLLRAQIILTVTRITAEDNKQEPDYPQKEVELISRYLMAVDTWTLHEINLFGNNIYILPMETAKILMVTATKNLAKYKSFHLYTDIMSGLLMNFTGRTLMENELELTWHYLQQLEKISHETLSGWQRELYLFTYGLYQILNGEQAQGLKKCRYILEYYELTGYRERLPSLRTTLTHILKKAKEI